MDDQVTVRAPATVANLGPGFDVLGLAIRGPGDTVLARRSAEPGVRIAAIDGDQGRLPLETDRNTAGVAAQATLRQAGVEVGVTLEVTKGMPINSGLGSSAASAVAAAYAVNLLIGSPLRKLELIGPCVEAEAAVSGRHADNVAPALLGGLVLVRSVEPLEVVRLPVPAGLMIVVVTPEFELSTRKAREALPARVELASMVGNSANLASLISACYSGDLGLLGRCMNDHVVTPARAPLIPGGAETIEAALSAGALGGSISGSGPSIFALCHSELMGQQVAEAMQASFAMAGLDSTATISPADCPGVRRAG